MVIKACILRTLAVCGLAITRQGHQYHGLELRFLANPLGYFQAIDARQANVEQHDVRAPVERRLDGADAFMRQMYLVTGGAQ